MRADWHDLVLITASVWAGVFAARHLSGLGPYDSDIYFGVALGIIAAVLWGEYVRYMESRE